ncbi:hypothetical protein SO802_018318 [Lithocarpus litseifolius]|uniref:GRF-type domain-containing protein n=1 Tax=Lithocarpus litseifolius TaxID=425828 RepID=A0AAW2CQ89_9ROSI
MKELTTLPRATQLRKVKALLEEEPEELEVSSTSSLASRAEAYAVIKELASLGATVHTCSPNETQLNECLHEWKMKGFRVTDRSLMLLHLWYLIVFTIIVYFVLCAEAVVFELMSEGSNYYSSSNGHLCDMDRCVVRTSLKLHNFGRRFYGCREWTLDDDRHCKFFRWLDSNTCKRGVETAPIVIEKFKRLENEAMLVTEVLGLGILEGVNCVCHESVVTYFTNVCQRDDGKTTSAAGALVATPVQPKLQHSAADSALAATPVQPKLQHSAVDSALEQHKYALDQARQSDDTTASARVTNMKIEG